MKPRIIGGGLRTSERLQIGCPVPIFGPGSHKTRSTSQHAHANYGTHCGQWQCSHSLQARSKAPFTQDAEVLTNVARKKMKHIIASWSVHTALQTIASNIKGFARRCVCKCACSSCVNRALVTPRKHTEGC